MPGNTLADQAALMDSIYRGQRHIYDLTRKYYLFGRDRLIDELAPPNTGTVLEVACGTGRNLLKVSERWPGLRLHGLDLSSEMLKSADAALARRAKLARGDATGFSSLALFRRNDFDRVILSYALSMIPDYPAAIEQALAAVAPGGSLHIVDFGDLDGLPRPLRALLRAWLARFHVTPRAELPEVAAAIAARRDFACHAQRSPLGYYGLVVISRPPGQH